MGIFQLASPVTLHLAAETQKDPRVRHLKLFPGYQPEYFVSPEVLSEFLIRAVSEEQP